MTKATNTKRLAKTAKKMAGVSPQVKLKQHQKALSEMAVNFNQAQERIAQLEGAMDSGKLIGRPEVVINVAARVAHEVNRVYCASIGDGSQNHWADAPDWQKKSCVEGVKAVLTNPAITPAEQHALWCRHKKAEGWVYGETKDAEAKTHPCIVPYSDLPAQQQTKDSLFGAAVRAVLGVTP